MTEFKNDKYFVRKTIVYYDEPQCVEKGLLDTFEPVTTQSKNYKNWRAILDLKTCIECRSRHGQIYSIDEVVDPEPPLHINCRCDIIPLESVEAGNATKTKNMVRIIGSNILANYLNIMLLRITHILLVGEMENLLRNSYPGK